MKKVTAHQVAKALAEHDKKMGRNVDRPMDVILALRDRINETIEAPKPEVRGLLIWEQIKPLMENYKNGVTSQELAEKTGIDASSIFHCLRRELTKGNVYRVEILERGTRKHYFSLKKFGKPTVQKQPTCNEAVVDFLNKNPKATAKQIAESVGFVPGSVWTSCRYLEKLGVLKVVGTQNQQFVYAMNVEQECVA